MPDERRYRKVLIDEGVIWDMVRNQVMDRVDGAVRNIPRDAKLLSVANDCMRKAFVFIFEHPSFDRVPMDEEIPDFSPRTFVAGGDIQPGQGVIDKAIEDASRTIESAATTRYGKSIISGQYLTYAQFVHDNFMTTQANAEVVMNNDCQAECACADLLNGHHNDCPYKSTKRGG